jgi:DNA end-binding protein Ku
VPDIETEDGDPPVTRSFWSGTITFGLVSIPVALYAANRSNRVSMRMVSPDGTPLSRRYFTSRDDRALEPDEIVRGYEVEKDRFVIADDEELERLAPERTRDIDLRQFVQASEIDPMYFERAYYLTPAGQSTKAYRLLARVMEETGRAGIATFVMRTKEYLVAIMAENGILRAETLRFADELRSPADVGLPEAADAPETAVKRMEREIGRRAADRLDPGELEDRSSERMMKVVRRKLRAGEDVVHPAPSEDGEGSADIIDLMEILKRRLQGETEEEEDDRGESPAKPARKTASKSSASKSAKSSKPAAKPASRSARKTASKTTAKSSRSAAKTASKTAAKSSRSAAKTASKSAAKSSSRSAAKSPSKAAAKSKPAAKRASASASKSVKRASAGDLSGSTRAELMARAQKLDVPGRSAMSKDELAAALRRA